jgi:hypothetical protein
LFVVTHQAPADRPEGGVYTFVTDGIEGALEPAEVIETPAAVHLRFRIAGRNG